MECKKDHNKKNPPFKPNAFVFLLLILNLTILTLLFEVSESDFSKDLSEYLTLMDFVVFFVYLFIIWFVLRSIKRHHEDENPAYKYFIPAFFAKIFFGLVFTFIYLFYYKGGDAISYYWCSRALSRLVLVNPQAAFSIIFFDERTWTTWSAFNSETSWPLSGFFFLKGDSAGVFRFTTPFMMLGFNYWLPALLLLNTFLFRGIWKFYLLVCKFYPDNMKWNAVAVLFIPSVLFWGSGIMKDSFTLACSLWMVTNIYYCFIEPRRFFTNFLMLILNAIIILTLKPYIFVALLPPAMFWTSYLYIKKINNKVVRIMAAPSLIIVGIALGVFVLSLSQSKLGVYGSSSGALKQAQIVQQDLVRSEQYGKNYYDIGKFDASISGVLKKAPVAIIAGLFRPFIWEAKNIVTLFSGIENAIILILTLYLLFRIGIKAVYKVIIKEPLILFSLIFSILFAFSVGLATANFGALVRYRILAIPFFLIAIVNTFHLIQKEKKHLKETPTL
jgi:hypothetical protein